MSTADQMGYWQRRSDEKRYRRMLSQTYQLDPRYLEFQEAQRSILLSRLKASYSDKRDTLLWALIVWTLGILTLTPLIGAPAAAEYAILVALGWAAVHGVRRI